MRLRFYQEEAKAAVYQYLETNPGGNPCVVIPTGGGKTPLLSAICADVAGTWGGRVLVLAHVKELLDQSADKLRHFMPADMVGVYSAGLDSRDTGHPVIVAGIQSVYKRAGELGAFSCIIIDEAHLINSANDAGMYRTFLDGARLVNPKVRIVGLTATPYRMESGYICGPENILNDIVYEVGVKELIVQGYLCPIRTRAGKEHPDLSGVHTRGGEFVESEMAERMDAIVGAACGEIVELTADRHSVLVFAAGVQHGEHVRAKIGELTGQDVGFVHGETPPRERAELLARFKGEGSGLFGGRLKYLVNVNVLTTGFDAPNVDTIVLLRATLSPGLYYQMVGRGLRLHQSKTECVVLDYGLNTVRHGPIDAIQIKDKNGSGDGEAPAKECPECATVVYAGVAVCPTCGFVFPRDELKHRERAGRAGVLSGEVTTTEYEVLNVRYHVHHKRGDPDAPTTMRVDYEIGWGRDDTRSEWLCFNHADYARQKAEQWWRDRCVAPAPETTEEAVRLANAGVLRGTKKIIWREVAGEKYGRIIGYDMEEETPTWEQIDAALVEADRKEEENRREMGEKSEPAMSGAGGKSWFDIPGDEIPF